MDDKRMDEKTKTVAGIAAGLQGMKYDDERLAEPWVGRAVERLVSLMEQTADLDVECGGLYHAAHGLALYRHRICAPAGETGVQ